MNDERELTAEELEKVNGGGSDVPSRCAYKELYGTGYYKCPAADTCGFACENCRLHTREHLHYE